MAASGQRRPDAAGQPVATNVAYPPALAQLIEAWPLLPPHIRETILTLVDAGGIKLSRVTGEPIAERNETAWRAARDCRHAVQGCLREDEWRDADIEFYEVIRTAIAGYPSLHVPHYGPPSH